MPCHPYEPGFAACVGYDVPPPRYPYGPGLPTSDAPAPPLLAASAVVLVPPTRPAPDDELGPVRRDVPEPSAVLLTVIALATLWRARRTVR